MRSLQDILKDIGCSTDEIESITTYDEFVTFLQEIMNTRQQHMKCPSKCLVCGELKATSICEDCSGLGYDVITEEKCSTCGGTGKFHDACTGRSYSDLITDNSALEHEVSRLKSTISTVMDHVEGRAKDTVDDIHLLNEWAKKSTALNSPKKGK